MTPTPDQLLALARKYRAMADLRRVKDAGDESTTRATLRALSREFPGCLRELDTLGLPELERRAAAAAAAARGGASEKWMVWIAAYHAVMRAALLIKPRLARPTAVPESEIESLAREASSVAGTELDAAFVRALVRPAEGRIGVVVFRHLASLLGAPARTISDALFPARRPSPYDL